MVQVHALSRIGETSFDRLQTPQFTSPREDNRGLNCECYRVSVGLFLPVCTIKGSYHSLEKYRKMKFHKILGCVKVYVGEAVCEVCGV